MEVAIDSDRQVVSLPDGYNGHTMRFFADPVEVNGEAVKLRCAEPGKEYMVAWRSRSALHAAKDFGDRSGTS